MSVYTYRILLQGSYKEEKEFSCKKEMEFTVPGVSYLYSFLIGALYK